MHGVEALRDLSPNIRLAELHRAFLEMPVAIRDQVAAGRLDIDGATEFRAGFDEFMRVFGHLSDSGTNFASVPWRDNPGLVLRMVRDFVEKRPTSARLPYQRLGIPLSDRPLLDLLFRRARDHRLYREQIGSLYTLGYGLFRNLFLELGSRLARRGSLRRSDDILFLYLPEVRETVAGKLVPAESLRLVDERRQDMARNRDTRLPSIIFGDVPPPEYNDSQRLLRGTATSPGYYTGPVRVVRGVADFDRITKGDVLVVPFTDVGWTPLFSRAGALVSESGGMLSHGSIIAREYGIPAVVSVPNACELTEGTVVAVDGYSGTIVVETAPKEA